MNRIYRNLVVVLALAVCAAAVAAEPPIGSAASLKRTIERLASMESRVTGYPGCAEAADYLEERLKELGLGTISSDEFKVVVPVDKGAELTLEANGKKHRFPLKCVWPNLVRTSKLPPRGIDGPLFYGGNGHMAEFDGKDLMGAIVLMEFNSSTRWLNAAQLGAKAIIFIEPEWTFRSDAEGKFLDTPVSVARYWISEADTQRLIEVLRKASGDRNLPTARSQLLHRLLAAQRAHLNADMVWQEVKARNLLATVPGTDRELRKDIIYIEAYYDSISVVPAVAPGADAACGVATLLELARWVKAHPPRRTVKFVITSGHFEALAGAREYAKKYLYTRYEAETEEEKARREEAKEAEQLELEAVRREGTRQPGILFLSLDLSSGESQLGLFFKGHFYNQYAKLRQEERLQREFIHVNERIMRYYEELDPTERPAKLFSGVVPKQDRDWSSLVPGQIALNSEVISLAGKPGMAFVTVNDARKLIDTPLDRPDRVNYENLEKQNQLLLKLFERILNDPELPLRYKLKQSRIGDSFCAVIEEVLLRYLPETRIPGCLVGLALNYEKALFGVRGRPFTISNKHGLFEFFGLDREARPFYRNVVAFKLDETTGVITYALRPRSGSRQRGLRPIWWRYRVKEWDKRAIDQRLPVFNCTSWSVFDLIDQLSLYSLSKMKVLDAKTDTKPQKHVFFLGRQTRGSSYSEPCAVIFAEPETPIKVTMTRGLTSPRLMLINATPEKPTGIGFTPDQEAGENFIYFTSYQVARDMHALDAYRMAKLRETGISNRRVDRLHGLAGKALKEAEKYLKERRYEKFFNASRAAWALESNAYPYVHGTANDVLRGILFYFAILLPFVLFTERLLIGAADIRNQLIWLGIIFTAVYAILRMVHPALRLSQTPIIILDGFFMVALGVMVIFLILNKFNQHMREATAKSSYIHRTDVARGSAAAAAFMLGISNMRKRKTRTTLTCITLILLTFSVISLVSFESDLRPQKVEAPYEKPYDGVLLRRQDWSALEEYAYYSILEYFKEAGGVVCPRYWISPARYQNLYLDAVNAAYPGREAYAVKGILGIDPYEKNLTGMDKFLVGHSKWFDKSDPDYPFVCILPKRIAEHLGLEPVEGKPLPTLRIMGNDLKVVGVLDDAEGMLDHMRLEHYARLPEDVEATRDGDEYVCPVCGERFKYARGLMSSVVDLDSEPLTPVDFAEMQERREEDATLELSDKDESGRDTPTEEMLPDPSLFYHQDPANVIVIPCELAVKVGATLRSIGIELKGIDINALMKKYMERSSLLLFAGIGDKVYLFSSRGKFSVKGMGSLLVPMAIAALIVFNTMLGSVYERMREIGIYASVGLAPMHISALFLAESCVYAVIGAVVGYLIGQVSAKFITLNLPEIGLNLNYSSSAAIWTTILVVSIVLLSTAYPARKAAQLSVPDETRKMKLPAPEGDIWSFIFPFTVSSAEALAMNMFLYEYFEGHDEDALGGFTADDIRLRRRKEGGRDAYLLESNVWIVPLDMGISQDVKIETIPQPDDVRLHAMKFHIHRKSGEVEQWRRMNLGFLRDVRKQLLIWRLVEADRKKELHQRGLEILQQSEKVPV